MYTHKYTNIYTHIYSYVIQRNVLIWKLLAHFILSSEHIRANVYITIRQNFPKHTGKLISPEKGREGKGRGGGGGGVGIQWTNSRRSSCRALCSSCGCSQRAKLSEGEDRHWALPVNVWVRTQTGSLPAPVWMGLHRCFCVSCLCCCCWRKHAAFHSPPPLPPAATWALQRHKFPK